MRATVVALSFFMVIGRTFAVPIPPSPFAVSAKAALSIRIVEENTGEGVEGVSVACILPSSVNIFGDTGYTIVTNATDRKGEVHFRGKVYNDRVECFVVDRTGYYPLPYLKVWFTNITESLVKKWLPYDEVQIVTLQKKSNPIPLFVREEDEGWYRDLTTAPDRKFCYDLVKGDWMPPFGKGEHADIEFKVLPRENFGIGRGPSGRPKPSFRDTVSVEFAEDGNGVIKIAPPPNAVLKVRSAPADGYLGKFSIWFGQTKTMQDDTNIDKEACHAFRIRTIKDKQGKIVSALYGKIYGDFRISYRYYLIPTGVMFTYYLNLTPNDRNLEWDMKHNLCPVRGSFNQP